MHAPLPMFRVATFKIAKTWKQPKGPLTKEQIKKIWCIYTQWNITKLLKKSEIMPFAVTWMDLEITILSEASQKENWYHLYVDSLQNRNRLTDIENRFVIAEGNGSVGEGWIGSLGLADANYYIWNG